MIKVISFTICPFVQRVTALLEALDVAYEIEYISLQNKPQWFLDISPNGQVPVLVTETGNALFESDAIVEYIDQVYGPLESQVMPEERALDRAWSYLAAKNYLAQCSAMRAENKAAFAERSQNLSSIFAKVESQLGGDGFFKGNALGHMDIAWLPLLHRADIIRRYTGFDFLADFPRVRQWQQGLLSTGIHTRSVSEDFEQRFTNFYLSQSTYLGSGQDCSNDLDQRCASGGCC